MLYLKNDTNLRDFIKPAAVVRSLSANSLAEVQLFIFTYFYCVLDIIPLERIGSVQNWAGNYIFRAIV